MNVGKIVFVWESSKEGAQSSGARQRRRRSLLLGAEGEHSANLSWSEGLTRNERKVEVIKTRLVPQSRATKRWVITGCEGVRQRLRRGE